MTLSVGYRKMLGWLAVPARSVLAGVGIYRASPDASATIVAVANDPELSARLLEELGSGYKVITRHFIRTICIYFGIFGCGLLTSLAIGAAIGSSSSVSQIPSLISGVAAVLYLAIWPASYRRKNARLFAAIALLGAVNAGCLSVRDNADVEARDRFARDLQENAVFAERRLKSCKGSRLYKRSVRRQARALRDALLSRIPDVASQDPQLKRKLVEDLARVVIRVSVARWDETDDIAHYNAASDKRTRIGRLFDVLATDVSVRPSLVTGIVALMSVMLTASVSVIVALMNRK